MVASFGALVTAAQAATSVKSLTIPPPETTAPTPSGSPTRTGPVTVDREKACRAYVSEAPGFAEHPLLAVPTRLERDADPAGSAKVTDETIVSPSEVEVRRHLAPGDSFTCTVTIRNRFAERRTFELNALGIRGATDAGIDILDADDPKSDTTAASWIEPLQRSVTLQSLGVARIPVTVTVPPNPPVGSAYGFLQVLPRVPGTDAAASVGVAPSVAVAFLLTIGGEGRVELHLRDQSVPRIRWNRAAFAYRATLANTGTLYVRPKGLVRVRSIFGSTVATLDIRGRTLLPGGSEPVATTWRGVPWIGFYRYDVRVTGPDAAGAPATASGWFIALPPWWVLAIAVLLLVLLIGGAVVRRRRELGWRDFLEDDDAG
ncbi:MAG: hypothetical protein JWN72_1743 [Thermoleophilia bacterium]|nr:hypothetical protein [Thermoleophilia bacterium]